MFRFHKLISLRLWFPMQTTSAACGLAYNRLNMYVLSHQDLSKVVRFIDDIIGAFLASPFKFTDFHSYRYRISFRSGNCMLGCLFGSKPLFELLYGPMTHVYVTLHHMVLHMNAEIFFTEQLISHYIDVTMTTMASQITSLTVVCSIVYSGADQRKHQSSVALAFVRGTHRDRWITHTKGQ